MTKPEIMRTNLLILESLLVLILLTRQLLKSRMQIQGWTILITYLWLYNEIFHWDVYNQNQEVFSYS